MKNILKKCFATTRSTIISIICIIAAVALVGSVTVYAAAKTTAIGSDAAANYAFADAGVDPTAAENLKTEFSLEAGQFVYEVEFTADGSEYEYLIKATDGTVVKKSVEIVTLDGATVTATAEITLDEAKAIALADAELTAEEVTFTEAKLDYDDGMSVYEVEFYTENAEYEYEINAATGAVYSKSKETHITESIDNTDNTGNIAETGTENTNTGTSESTETSENNANDTTGTADSNSGSSNTGSNSNDSGTTGSAGNGATGSTGNGTTGSTGNGTTGGADSGTTTEITLAEAKAIALADAGVTESDVTYTKAKTDKDDGVAVYDIEFNTSTKEYEYEIRVSDGKILDKDVETIKTSTGSSNTGNSTTGSNNSNGGNTTGSGSTTDTYITVDEAKTIALNKAGLSASDVTFEKAKLEKDDGIMVYEIEFSKGRTEYECTVNATTGTIIEYEVDVDD